MLTCLGGGHQKLFRKVDNVSSAYCKVRGSLVFKSILTLEVKIQNNQIRQYDARVVTFMKSLYPPMVSTSKCTRSDRTMPMPRSAHLLYF